MREVFRDLDKRVTCSFAGLLLLLRVKSTVHWQGSLKKSRLSVKRSICLTEKSLENMFYKSHALLSQLHLFKQKHIPAGSVVVADLLERLQ